jgi:hypothetical protein
MDSFHWLRENTPEDSVVAIEWSYGHLMTGVARRPTVVDGVESTGEVGKWENAVGPKPPDYVYTVKDSTGTFLDQNFTINGRRTDIQRLPGLGSDNEVQFYLKTYRDNYGVKIDYWVTHVYQVYDMIFGTLRGGTKSSRSTSIVENFVSYSFQDENVYYDPVEGEAFVVNEGEKQYFAGVVFDYYTQGGEIGTPFNYNFRKTSQIPRVFWIFVPNWVSAPTYEQTVALQSGPYYYGPPLYTRIFGGTAPLPSFMSLAYTSSNGIVSVVKVHHTPETISPKNGAKENTSNPDFTWYGAVGADRYELEVDNDPSFSSPEIKVWLSSNSLKSSIPLSNGTYYWRVGAYDSDKLMAWSETSKFIIEAIPPAAEELPGE